MLSPTTSSIPDDLLDFTPICLISLKQKTQFYNFLGQKKFPIFGNKDQTLGAKNPKLKFF